MTIEGLDKKVPLVGDEPVTLTDRRLSKATLEKYGVTLRYDDKGEVTHHMYPYFDKHNTHVATKVRVVDGKQFFSTGTINDSVLFGQHLAPAGGKFITITEGEIDAMSVFEMMGYPAISVKGSSCLANIKDQYEYINSFETIILAFDTDTARTRSDGTLFYPGQESADRVARLFKAGKVRLLNHSPFKDANDFLTNGAKEGFKKAWWGAQVFQRDGIVCGTSLWDEVIKEDKYFSVPYPFEMMNKRLYGMRTSEMITLTAGTGVGKTTLVKFLACHIKDVAPPDVNIGMMMLEETKRETSIGLMSVAAKRPLHLPDTECSLDDRRKAFDETIGCGRFFLHDHFGSTSIDNVLEKVDILATQYDCKYIIIDHISIIVSDQQNGDERRALDEIATKLKTFAIAKDVCLIIICHLKRVSGESAEEGGQISLSDLRGTAAIGQLSNIVLAVERNLQGEAEASNMKIRCLKDRFAGRTGVVMEAAFDYDRYTYNEILPSTEENSFTPPTQH